MAAAGCSGNPRPLHRWSYLLADQLREAGAPVGVSCVDPGTVATKLLYNVILFFCRGCRRLHCKARE